MSGDGELGGRDNCTFCCVISLFYRFYLCQPMISMLYWVWVMSHNVASGPGACITHALGQYSELTGGSQTTKRFVHVLFPMQRLQVYSLGGPHQLLMTNCQYMHQRTFGPEERSLISRQVLLRCCHDPIFPCL